jgi:uncharacterized DUF497 family protein
MDLVRFIWDERKSVSNLKKHGISFDEAVSVFADDFARLIQDPDSSEGEARFILLGMSARLNVLVVCHCERGKNTIRLISARKADKSERDQYEGYRHA